MQVEEARVRTRQLQSFVAQTRRPFGDSGQGIEWRAVIRKLRDEQRWSLDRTHAILPYMISSKPTQLPDSFGGPEPR
jgi:hypothetical protein